MDTFISEIIKIRIIKQKVLLPAFYLPPISWFALFMRSENEIIIEQEENFPKQTYRNRTNIYGANGKLSLIIPIIHTGKKVMKEVEVFYAEDWQKQHWRSIKNSYQNSPYFEYYEDQLIKLYQKEEKYLLDLNLNAISIIQDLLKTEKAYSLNSEFQKFPNEVDLRNDFSAKRDPEIQMEEYYQIFTDKYGFMKDLSIIDLVCNKGPESITYLKNII